MEKNPTKNEVSVDAFFALVQNINALIWHEYVLYSLLATGVLFSVWSVSSQYQSLVHGTAITLGHYDDPHDPGAINHFQALSTALSATVGLGNIGGVAIAIGLGGPGAVFWMWVVGLLGMSIKVIEVTLSMMYRNVDDPDNPHGGPMWVAKRAFAEMGPNWAKLGAFLGGTYCVGMLFGVFVGGNMFQAWNVADVSASYFGWSRTLVGVTLAVIVGGVLIGGIKRIGQVTSFLVPIMCLVYMLAGLYVIITNITLIPETFALIFKSAFNPTEAQGAFIGGSAGAAMMWGMKRALYSSEVGQGSSAIAHSAAKTDEPVREGLVAGLEPFIDTLVVCTITAMVILLSGVWNRGPDTYLNQSPIVVASAEHEAGTWVVGKQPLPQRQQEGNSDDWQNDSQAFMLWQHNDGEVSRWYGVIETQNGKAYLILDPLKSPTKPTLQDAGVFQAYAGASLTALAFNRSHDNFGKWLVTIAAWMFAISTMISWGYYGEQGISYLFGNRAILPYKILFCSATFIATSGLMRTTSQLDGITTLGAGVLLIICLPITLIFGHKAVAAYKEYISKLKAGDFDTDYHRTKLSSLVGRDKTQK
ncbi:MAG: AGCS family alanine or glycine:cation symporter [Candidatus Azotimanducaceae bacterium]